MTLDPTASDLEYRADMFRVLAAVCRADAREYEEHDPSFQERLDEMVAHGQCHMFVYQAAAEHRKMTARAALRPGEVEYLRSLAARLDRVHKLAVSMHNERGKS